MVACTAGAGTLFCMRFVPSEHFLIGARMHLDADPEAASN